MNKKLQAEEKISDCVYWHCVHVTVRIVYRPLHGDGQKTDGEM